MDVGVAVKAALDLNVLRSNPDGTVAVDNIPLVISEYDRNAVYEARRIADSTGGRVIIYSFLTWWPADRKEKDFENVIREALALGGDEAYVVVDSTVSGSEPRFTARVLASLVRRYGSPSLVLTGEASTDMTTSSVAPYLAAMLGYSVVTFARSISLRDGGIVVERDVEDYIETVRASLPAVVSVTGEINSPRLPTLLQIRKAFRKPLVKTSLSELGLNPMLPRYSDYRLVTVKRKRVILEDGSPEELVERLVSHLVEEGVLKR